MNTTSQSFGLRTNSRVTTRPNVDKNNQESIQSDNIALFNEMIEKLDKYKSDQIKAIHNNTQVENDNFKKNFFTSLENLLNQIAQLKDKKLKTNKIETVYKWFNFKMTFFNDLNTITKRTDKNVYENYSYIDTNVKSDYYEAGNYPRFFERDHRTEDEGLMPPKDRLDLIILITD